MGTTAICEKCNSKGYGRCVCENAPSSCTVDSIVRRAVQEHTMLSAPEKAAIERALDAGAQYGYGNVMTWLATEWAVHLRDKWNLPESVAIEAVSGRGPYPLPQNK